MELRHNDRISFGVKPIIFIVKIPGSMPRTNDLPNDIDYEFAYQEIMAIAN